MNTKLLSTAAAEAFKLENYELAHKYYLELAKLLGRKNVEANIKLCERRLGLANSGDNTEYADTTQLYNELQYSLKKEGLWKHLYQQALLQGIEDQNARYHKKFDLRVGIITDEFMYNYYAGAIEQLIPLTPENYESAFASGIDVLLFVSCWFGLNNEWRGVTFDPNLHRKIDAILSRCRQTKVPTVFQTIEDPSNYQKFLEIAKKFDCVFTTDVDMIKNYRKDCGHDRVFFGEYGFNPVFNNPIASSRPRINAAFFAGSYPQRYKERCQDMEEIFDSVIRSGARLVVADRNYGTADKNLKYPDKYTDHIIDKFDHRVLQNVHKLFRFNLNLNSIKNSPTMCAMRVYELQAQGELLLSNYARPVQEHFPSVKIVQPGEDLSGLFKKSVSGHISEKRLRTRAVRQMYTDKTVFDQAGKMFSTIGIPESRLNRTFPRVYVLYNRLTQKIKSSFEAQSYSNKTLVDFDSFMSGRVQYERHDYFAFFSDNYSYTRDYLMDQINCFKFTNARYVTKLSVILADRYIQDIENEFTNRIHDLALTVFSCSIVEEVSPRLLSPSGMPFLLEFGFANNPFEADSIVESVL